jgi:hypothetical protein
MRRFVLLPTLVAALGLTAVGCGDDTGSLPPGNLSIHWLVGSSDCERAGVTTIAVFLTGERALGTDVRTFDCRDGGALLTGLRPGVYSLSFRGRDANNVDRFGGEVTGVEVRSNGTTTVQTVRLSALPAEMRVTWYFENGRMCAFNGVANVEIVLYRAEYEIFSTVVPCIDALVELQDIQADTYDVEVLGLDDGGRARFVGQEQVQVGRGDRATVEVRLVAVPSTRAGAGDPAP